MNDELGVVSIDIYSFFFAYLFIFQEVFCFFADEVCN